MEGWTDDGRTHRQMEGHVDVQRETIIPRHYCVAEYKNVLCGYSISVSCGGNSNEYPKHKFSLRIKKYFSGHP